MWILNLIFAVSLLNYSFLLNFGVNFIYRNLIVLQYIYHWRLQLAQSYIVVIECNVEFALLHAVQ